MWNPGPHPGVRKLLWWTGVSLQAALLAVLIISTNWAMTVGGVLGLYIHVRHGSIRLLRIDPADPGVRYGMITESPGLERVLPKVDWGGRVHIWGNGTGEIMVPLWLVLVLMATPAAVRWWRKRRPLRWKAAGRCEGCGYDRRGIPENIACPECGLRAGTTTLVLATGAGTSAS